MHPSDPSRWVANAAWPVHRTFERLAGNWPEAPAVLAPGRTVSYQELDRAANGLAHRLIARGVRGETPVGVMVERSIALVTAVTGIFKAGGSAVMIDPSDPPERRRALDEQAKASLVLTSADLHAITPADEPPQATDVSLENAAYVLRTSGSTGEPKPLVVPHRVLTHTSPWQQVIQRIEPRDRGAWLAAPTTGVSMLVELWPFLTAGASIALPPPYVGAAPDELRDWIITAGISHAYLVGPLAQALGELTWPADIRLRLVQVGSDRLHRWPSEDLPFEIGTCYGTSEANMICTSLYPWDRRDTSRTVRSGPTGEALPTMGREWPDVEVRILDEELRPVPAGAAGEVYVAGPELARGYLDARATAVRFLPDPFGRPGGRVYRTGDLARRGGNGLLHHLGRIDHQVRIRGHRVELGEVEGVLLRHPAVRQVVVTAVEGEDGERSLIAYVVGAPRSVVPVAELFRLAATHLPAAAQPRHVMQLAKLPLTANRKVDRARLPAPPAPERSGADGALSGDSELAEIQRAWAAALRRASFGPDENFFLAGGDSLSAARSLTALRETLGPGLTLRDVVLHPTARELLDRWHAIIREAPS